MKAGRPKRGRRVLATAVTIVLCYLGFASSPAVANEGMVAREVVAQLRSATLLPAVRASYGLELLRRLGPRPVYLFRVPIGRDPDQVAVAMRADARVAFAEPNYRLQEPEALKRAVWAIGSAAAYASQWAPQSLRLGDAHAYADGNGVTVAVLDTGVQSSHPALAGRLVPGYDFIDRDAVPAEVGSPRDLGFGHGTHVAGIVALTAPGARIMPLRVLGADGRGDIWRVAEALIYAADPDGNPHTADHARVVNLSLGTTAPTQLLDKVVELITCSDDDDDENDDDYSDPGFAEDLERCNLHHGVVVIAAAGNSGSASERWYPAAEGAEGALAVTASTRSDRLAGFANRGEWVQLAAPGDGITSSVPGGYGVWSGTSMAAPFVAGVAALLLDANEQWKPVDVTKRMLERAARLCDGTLPRLDAYGALYDQVPLPLSCND